MKIYFRIVIDQIQCENQILSLNLIDYNPENIFQDCNRSNLMIKSDFHIANNKKSLEICNHNLLESPR